MAETSSLARLSQVQTLLAEARTIQQIKEVRDAAMTVVDWAKRRGLGSDVVKQGQSYVTQADIKLGEHLLATERAKGTKGQLRGRKASGGPHLLPPEDNGRTLAKLGITKRISSETQKLAALPKPEQAAVVAGEKTRTKAIREAVKKEKRTRPLPKDKYTVIYADPPWNYSDKLGGDISDSYGAAEKHYPSMTLTELKDLGIAELAADNAVLFLWVTSPLLPWGLEVARAWGFTYKASFVWDKVKHNMGHYNSVRHEFLLVCVRGSCTPQVDKLFDSVQSIERAPKHSQKPEQFRQIIDTLYPQGRRIELFARTRIDHWEAWGNEP